VFGKERNRKADFFTNMGEIGLFLWGQYRKEEESGL
jgi:hypothetical protein